MPYLAEKGSEGYELFAGSVEVLGRGGVLLGELINNLAELFGHGPGIGLVKTVRTRVGHGQLGRFGTVESRLRT